MTRSHSLLCKCMKLLATPWRQIMLTQAHCASWMPKPDPRSIGHTTTPEFPWGNNHREEALQATHKLQRWNGNSKQSHTPHGRPQQASVCLNRSRPEIISQKHQCPCKNEFISNILVPACAWDVNTIMPKGTMNKSSVLYYDRLTSDWHGQYHLPSLFQPYKNSSKWHASRSPTTKMMSRKTTHKTVVNKTNVILFSSTQINVLL